MIFNDVFMRSIFKLLLRIKIQFYPIDNSISPIKYDLCRLKLNAIVPLGCQSNKKFSGNVYSKSAARVYCKTSKLAFKDKLNLSTIPFMGIIHNKCAMKLTK